MDMLDDWLLEKKDQGHIKPNLQKNDKKTLKKLTSDWYKSFYQQSPEKRQPLNPEEIEQAMDSWIHGISTQKRIPKKQEENIQ